MRYAILPLMTALMFFLSSLTPGEGLAQNTETDTLSCIPNYLELRKLRGMGQEAADAQEEAWTNARIEAINSWQKEHEADINNARAKFCLASLYSDLYPESTDAEKSRSLELLEEAAALGYLPAMTSLGAAYLDGFYGLDPDLSRGERLVRNAANGGYSSANLHLGLMYCRGDIIQDNERCYRRLKLAWVLAREQNDEFMIAWTHQYEPMIEGYGAELSTIQKRKADQWIEDWEPSPPSAQQNFGTGRLQPSSRFQKRP